MSQAFCYINPNRLALLCHTYAADMQLVVTGLTELREKLEHFQVGLDSRDQFKSSNSSQILALNSYCIQATTAALGVSSTLNDRYTELSYLFSVSNQNADVRMIIAESEQLSGIFNATVSSIRNSLEHLENLAQSLEQLQTPTRRRFRVPVGFKSFIHMARGVATTTPASSLSGYNDGMSTEYLSAFPHTPCASNQTSERALHLDVVKQLSSARDMLDGILATRPSLGGMIAEAIFTDQGVPETGAADRQSARSGGERLVPTKDEITTRGKLESAQQAHGTLLTAPGVMQAAREGRMRRNGMSRPSIQLQPHRPNANHRTNMKDPMSSVNKIPFSIGSQEALRIYNNDITELSAGVRLITSNTGPANQDDVDTSIEPMCLVRPYQVTKLETSLGTIRIVSDLYFLPRATSKPDRSQLVLKPLTNAGPLAHKDPSKNQAVGGLLCLSFLEYQIIRCVFQLPEEVSPTILWDYLTRTQGISYYDPPATPRCLIRQGFSKLRNLTVVHTPILSQIRSTVPESFVNTAVQAERMLGSASSPVIPLLRLLTSR